MLAINRARGGFPCFLRSPAGAFYMCIYIYVKPFHVYSVSSFANI